jgi:hypothetical protein
MNELSPLLARTRFVVRGYGEAVLLLVPAPFPILFQRIMYSSQTPPAFHSTSWRTHIDPGISPSTTCGNRWYMSAGIDYKYDDRKAAVHVNHHPLA